MSDSEPGDASPPRRRKRKAPPKPAEPPPPQVVETWLPPWLSVVAGVLGASFLVMVFADTAGTSSGHWGCERDFNRIAGVLPGPARYFTQVACLFPSANLQQTEYHAEGWSCRDKVWRELDVRPWFPIDEGEKENRFSRALHFHRTNRPVMNALDEYIVTRANKDALAAAAHGGGGDVIGGVRFSNLRIPLPALGEHVDRYAWHPLASAPPAWKKDHYWSLWSKRRERCLAFDASYDDRAARAAEAAARKETEPKKPAPTSDPGDGDHDPEAP